MTIYQQQLLERLKKTFRYDPGKLFFDTANRHIRYNNYWIGDNVSHEQWLLIKEAHDTFGDSIFCNADVAREVIATYHIKYGQEQEKTMNPYEIEELKAKLKSANERCDYWQKDSVKNHNSLEAERKKTNEQAVELERLSLHSDVISKNANLKAQIETANRVIKESKDKYDVLCETNLRHNKTIVDLTEEKNLLKTSIENLTRTITSIKNDRVQLTANNKMLQESVNILKCDSEVRRRRIVELEGRQLVQNLVDDLEARVEKMESFFRNNEGWV